ncbi:hypothetical protein C1Y40_02164 [Mycobacterium talmoniae]|uniref:Peptidase n=2 Tax=Mycobacterium talmoniae TaxID=1858794 RepID=A0A2S8BLS9_9MYCO|nr:hypothetical protein C1Y40_02164 [Mycobacterium talmoniae]
MRRLSGPLCAALAAVLVLAGCGSVVDGHPVSMLYNPAQVGGLPVTDGPNGPRDNAPAPTGTVTNTDHGKIDELVTLAINDIEAYWKDHYEGLKRTFTPVPTYISYDSTDPRGPMLCPDEPTYQNENAMFGACRYPFKWDQTFIAWDRGSFMPTAEKYFGPMAVVGVLAHEYGHALQSMSGLADKSTPVVVKEQQADCFAGVYLHWVAEDQSSRFTLNTTEGLNHVLAGVIMGRDPVLGPGDEKWIKKGHGTALDRVGAFQMGFDTGTAVCAAIDMAEIEQRRGDLPMALRPDDSGDVPTGDVDIDKDTLSALMDVMNKIYSPQQPPTLSYDTPQCADAQASPPASYCPATNTISVDLAALEEMGTPADERKNKVMLQGDDTALSVVMSRYTLALQHQRGVELTSAMAGLRTACLTGVGQRGMAEPAGTDGKGLILTAGDLDEAVTGLLANGLAASDVNGNTVPAGFTRILAFRSGVLDGDADRCYQRFP